jgi:hypothetical protein
MKSRELPDVVTVAQATTVFRADTNADPHVWWVAK